MMFVVEASRLRGVLLFGAEEMALGEGTAGGTKGVVAATAQGVFSRYVRGEQGSLIWRSAVVVIRSDRENVTLKKVGGFIEEASETPLYCPQSARTGWFHSGGAGRKSSYLSRFLLAPKGLAALKPPTLRCIEPMPAVSGLQVQRPERAAETEGRIRRESPGPWRGAIERKSPR